MENNRAGLLCFMQNQSNHFFRLCVLFWEFFLISAFTLGGGLAMIPMIREQFVVKHKWLGDGEMVDIIAVAQSLPGIIGANVSVLVGYGVSGVSGALSATLGMILPPFVAIVALASLVGMIRGYACVQAMFLGVRSAATALILLALVAMAKKCFSGNRTEKIFAVSVALAGFIAIYFLEVNVLAVIVVAALLGAFLLPRLTGGKRS